MWNDHYNAACAWSRAGNKDSAFAQLEILVARKFSDLVHLAGDEDFESLHTDARWEMIFAKVRANKEKAEASLDKKLVAILDTVFENDQKYRNQFDAIEKKYGQRSKEMTDLWKTINYYDSADLEIVVAILDKYGWVGPDVVGGRGSSAIFLVIQHSDIAIQDKYLPLMCDAVKNKKADPSSLALLEDRVALRHGKKQIYGSQIGRDAEGNYFVDKLEDPDNVDKRRAEVGLGPLAEYVGTWNIKWDPAAYKKELAEKEKKEKKK